MMLKTLLTSLLITTSFISGAVCEELIKRNDIRVRDPFIFADAKTKTYYMYVQSANRSGSGYQGVEVYTSKDLKLWNQPQTILTIPNHAGVNAVWAPEVHEFKGSYYLFVTLTKAKLLEEKKPVKKSNWPAMHRRGTHIYRSDSLAGPFKAFKSTPHTPEQWMALDGTLFVEKGVPYMVFCHEWVQTIDGSMDYVQLKQDLSGTVGEPKVLFKASEAPGARTGAEVAKITDGCFLYRSASSGKLFMIWSTFIPGSGYCVVLTESTSGGIKGPWINQRLIYKNNGGHGMIFRSFDGRLLMALHQPNSGAKERLHLFNVTDLGKTLVIKKMLASE